MPNFNDGDYVIYAVGPGGGFRDTTPGKPYEIKDGQYVDEDGELLWVDGWRFGNEFTIDRILSPEQYEAEFGVKR